MEVKERTYPKCVESLTGPIRGLEIADSEQDRERTVV